MRRIWTVAVTALAATSLGVGFALAGPTRTAPDCGSRNGTLIPCIVKMVYTGTANVSAKSYWCGGDGSETTERITWRTVWTHRVELRYGRDFSTSLSVSGNLRLDQPACGTTVPATTCTWQIKALPGSSSYYVATRHPSIGWFLGAKPYTGAVRVGPACRARAVPREVDPLDLDASATLKATGAVGRHTKSFPIHGRLFVNGGHGYGKLTDYDGRLTVTGVW